MKCLGTDAKMGRTRRAACARSRDVWRWDRMGACRACQLCRLWMVLSGALIAPSQHAHGKHTDGMVIACA